MSIYQSSGNTQKLHNPVVTIGGATVAWASKAEVSVEHNIKEHDTFDGDLLSTKSLPGGSVSLTRLTKHDNATEAEFLTALGHLVPEDDDNGSNSTAKKVVITDTRKGGKLTVTMTGVYIDKYSANFEGSEIPEYNVDLKSETITIFAG